MVNPRDIAGERKKKKKKKKKKVYSSVVLPDILVIISLGSSLMDVNGRKFGDNSS